MTDVTTPADARAIVEACAKELEDKAARLRQIIKMSLPASPGPVIGEDRAQVMINAAADLRAKASEIIAALPARTEAQGRAIMASARLGKWMSAALDDPAVCNDMKADIREWFSAGEPVEGWAAALPAQESAIDKVMADNPGWQQIEQIDRDACDKIIATSGLPGELMPILVAHRMASAALPQAGEVEQ